MDVRGDRQDGYGGGIGFAQSADQEVHASAAAHFAHAHAIGTASVTISHKRGVTLVPGEDVANLIRALIEGIVKDDAGIARHAKDQIDAGLDQALRQDIGAASLKLSHRPCPPTVQSSLENTG